MDPLADLLVAPTLAIREVLAALNRNQKGVALVVDADRRLLDTITDGDIRRALLAGCNLDDTVARLMEAKRARGARRPLTAMAGTPPEELSRLMKEHHVRQIPLLDAAGRVMDAVALEDLLPPARIGVPAVIMAGGQGTRLRPLTEHLPKPMLPVGGRPVMEHTIQRLRDAGIQQIRVTTHYKPESIQDYFGKGDRFGVDIEYIHEETPLGTAGALRLLPSSDQPYLVVNGDVVTDLDFRALLDFHEEAEADMTVSVRQYEVRVPYGVVEVDGTRVRGITEKPTLSFLANAGVYLVEPEALRLIPAAARFEMTDLISLLLERGKRVLSFPIHEYWIDIGRFADYERAQEDMRNGSIIA